MSNKPQWRDLPEWVEWIAQDESGEWYGYADEPRPGAYCYWPTVTTWWIVRLEVGVENPNWRETLEKRPDPSEYVQCEKGHTHPVDQQCFECQRLAPHSWSVINRALPNPSIASYRAGWGM